MSLPHELLNRLKSANLEQTEWLIMVSIGKQTMAANTLSQTPNPSSRPKLNTVATKSARKRTLTK